MSAPRGPQPPRLVRSLLSLAFHPEDRPFAMADLDEEFMERVEAQGRFAASWWYRRQGATSIVPALRGRTVRRARRGDGGRDYGFFTALGSDLTLGGRMMLRSPMMTVLTVLSLGVGLGGVTVVVAVVNGLILQPPVGIENPEQIVSVYRTAQAGHAYGELAYADYTDVADELDALGSVTAVSARPASLSADFSPMSVFAERVTPNFFAVTGMRPALGRFFSDDDFASGGETRVAVLGHDLWTSRFDGRDRVLGSTIRIDGIVFTVIGVAPDDVRSRRVPLETDVWIPLGSLQSAGALPQEALGDRMQRDLTVFGRLNDDATIEAVQVQADVLASRLASAEPDAWVDPGAGPQTFSVVSEARSRTNPRARAILLGVATFFFAVAGMILLLACANVAGLFVARAHRRKAEMAVRASLGASRGRIVRMLLAEGIWPGLLGAALGVGVASWAMRLMQTISLPVEVPIRLDIELTPRVLLFTLVAALVATLAFSLLPALGSARADVASALREGRTGARARFWSIRNSLVIVQCATSAILVIGATLFVRTLSVASDADLGFDHDGVAAATHRLPTALGAEAGVEALRDLQGRLLAQDGIESVAMSSVVELTLFQTLEPRTVEVAGYEVGAGEAEPVFHNAVTPGYLELLDVPMLAGRTIEDVDRAGSTPVAVINQTFAERYWPGQDAVGQTFAFGAGEEARRFEVVGLARDGMYLDFDDAPMPFFWSSLYQDFTPHVGVLVKGSGPAHEHLTTLRRELIPEDGVVQLMPPSVLTDQVSIQFLHLRVLSGILGWGGLFGLFLAAIGIYGVVAFAVSQRSREMAIRVALGAEKGDVVRSVAMDGVRLAALGLAVGVVIAVPSASLIRSILAGVNPTDPRALAGALSVLVVVAVTASIVPARRITRVDPMVTLRAE